MQSRFVGDLDRVYAVFLSQESDALETPTALTVTITAPDDSTTNLTQASGAVTLAPTVPLSVRERLAGLRELAEAGISAEDMAAGAGVVLVVNTVNAAGLWTYDFVTSAPAVHAVRATTRVVA